MNTNDLKNFSLMRNFSNHFYYFCKNIFDFHNGGNIYFYSNIFINGHYLDIDIINYGFSIKYNNIYITIGEFNSYLIEENSIIIPVNYLYDIMEMDILEFSLRNGRFYNNNDMLDILDMCVEYNKEIKEQISLNMI